MKRILLSLGAIAFVGALAAGATGAFFSDTETSTGNTFTAGAIDLKIDNTSYVTNGAGVLVASPANTWALSDLTDQLFFSFTDLKPGDIGEDTISVHAGTNDAWACMAANMTSTPDNGINDPETTAGDVTDGPLGGELQNFLNFVFWSDDGDNVFEVGESQITQLTGPASGIFNGVWFPLADSSMGTTSVIVGGSTRYIGKAWCFGTLTPNQTTQDLTGSSTPLTRGTTGFTCDGSGDNNIAQTDGIVVDVSFQAVQARNNGAFLCSSLPPLTGTTTPPVDRPIIGANLSAYVDPTSCDVTATTTIANAIATAVAGNTVCVPDGTFTENVVIDKDITLAGSGATSTSIIAGDVAISADGATLEGFQINGNVTSDFDGITIQYNKILPLAAGNGITFGGAVGVGSTIRHNVVTTQALTSPNNRGIYLDQNGTIAFIVDHNTVTARKSGFGTLSSGTVQNNVFEGYDVAPGVGWEVVTDPADTLPVISLNNFNESPGIGVANIGTQTFDAPSNWWGDASSAGNTSGPVTTSNDQASAYPQN